MSGASIGKVSSCILGICLCLGPSITKAGSPYVEVRADIQWTAWPFSGPSLPAEGTNFPKRISDTIGYGRREIANFTGSNTNRLTQGSVVELHQDCKVRCTVGAEFSSFEIIGDFSAYPHTTYWFLSNGVVQKIIASKPAFTSGVGEGWAAVFTSLESFIENAAKRRGIDNVPWLAFCSGSFFQTAARRIPLPIGVALPLRSVPSYFDTRSLFADTLGLPKRLELYTADKQLLCQYRVEHSTNLLGWNFPLKFSLMQYRLNNEDQLVPHGLVEGKVTSIDRTTEPQIPEDVLKDIHWR